MGGGRRLAVLLAILLVVAAPAIALRAACAGKSCDDGTTEPGPVPFCSLDRATRELLVAGFRQGRGPDVLAVTGATQVVTDIGDGARVPWPSAGSEPPLVPLSLTGPGIRSGPLPEGVSLDQVAPTLEPFLGMQRPHPEVRSGSAIDGVVEPGGHDAPLVVMLVWKAAGLRSAAVQQALSRATPRQAASGLATTGSLPLDPAAVLATIGSGGIPEQHGVGGTTVRTEEGRLVSAFSPAAPAPVIAALGDDLDRGQANKALVGLIGTAIADRGLIGGTWYGGVDDDRLDLGSRSPVRRVRAFLGAGWGHRTTTGEFHDLLGVVLRDDPETMARQTGGIIAAVRRSVPGAVIVITTTGTEGPTPGAVPANDVIVHLDSAVGTDVVAGPAVGGLFLDPDAMAAAGLSAGDIATEMRTLTAPDGSPLFADVFPAFAVEFARYC